MLLGARQFFERRGAPWRNPYVTDGLIAMWDGEWNAGGGVHDAAATTWKDIAGSRKISIPSGYSWSDKYIETNVGNFAQMSEAFDSYMVMECVFMAYSLGVAMLYLGATADANKGWRNTNERGLAYRGNGQLNFAGAGKYIAGPTINTICSAGVQFSSALISIGVDVSVAWMNGETVPVSSSGGMYGLGAFQGFGISPYSGYKFKGRIYSLRLYSRALTAAEVAANYAIDKARFNLQ